VRLSQGIPSAPGAANSLQPGAPFPARNNATAGTAFGALSSTVENKVGIGTNRQLQLSLRICSRAGRGLGNAQLMNGTDEPMNVVEVVRSCPVR
jgi:hypothetical protein